MRKNKIMKILMVLLAAMLAMGLASMPAFAASKASQNKKAIALYEKKAKSLLKETRDTVTSIRGRYKDLTGDGIKECLFIYPDKYGSGLNFRIYTYKNGKIKCILKDAGYGIEKFTVYPKSKSIIMYQAGHGGDAYRYYKMKNGKYKSIALKGRVSLKGGSERNGAWNYSTGSGKTYKTMTKKQFNAKIKNMKKGKKIVIKPY